MTQSLAPEITNPQLSPQEWEQPPFPDLTNVIIEDDEPVDNLISEKQQRFLVSCLYSSFAVNQPFLAAANVGLFYTAKKPPLVPDVLLSLDVTIPEDWSEKRNRAYFTWNFGKFPEVAIEIVSNKVGNELGSKLTDYAQARVSYYIVFDPLNCLGTQKLSIYQLTGMNYQLLDTNWLEGVGLGLTIWEGEFEGKMYQWLRWCDAQGQLLLTGDEQAQKEKQRAEVEKQRAETEKQRADYLEQILRSQGIDF